MAEPLLIDLVLLHLAPQITKIHLKSMPFWVYPSMLLLWVTDHTLKLFLFNLSDRRELRIWLLDVAHSMLRLSHRRLLNIHLRPVYTCRELVWLVPVKLRLLSWIGRYLSNRPHIRSFCHIEVESLQLRRFHWKLGSLSDNAFCALSSVVLARGEFSLSLDA